MSDRMPVSTMADLATLDANEVLEGYRDGLGSDADDPEPGGNRSRSYWHGWRNGRTDRYLAEPDDAQLKLAHALRKHRINAGGEG